jgi:hypothetical protein
MRLINNQHSVISELLFSVFDDPIPVRVEVVAEKAVAHVATAALIDVLVVLAQFDVLLFPGLLLGGIHLHVLQAGQLGEVVGTAVLL